MDNNKDEELEFAAQENKQLNKEEEGVNSFFSGVNNVFSEKKTETEKGDKDAENEEFDIDDYPDKKKLKRMNFGLWLSESRENINRAFVILLILISVGFFSFSVYNLVNYLKAGDPGKEIIDDNLILIRNEIKPLTFSQVYVFPNNLKNDLAIFLKNDNPRFYAKFDYCFKQGETELECKSNFILPEEEKYVISFGADAYLSEGAYSFSISKISWNRIPKEIMDYQAYFYERLNFPIYNISFNPAANRVSGNIDINSLEFNLSNSTAFSYYEVPLNILVFSSQDLIGVNRQVINNFLTGEERKINLSWAGDLRASRRVEIIPEIDIFDSQVFLKYQGN